MRRDLTSSLLAILVLTVVLGLAYPLLTTGAAQVLFPGKADGSRVERDGKTVGSRLIAQDFGRARGFFHPRPSADRLQRRRHRLQQPRPEQRGAERAAEEEPRSVRPRGAPWPGEPVPVDAVTASASASIPTSRRRTRAIQARRVAAARDLQLKRVLALVDAHTDGRGVGVFGEPGVNVLELNLTLAGS